MRDSLAATTGVGDAVSPEVTFLIGSGPASLRRKSDRQAEDRWSASDVQHYLGYTDSALFREVLSRAQTACAASGGDIAGHFAPVSCDDGEVGRGDPDLALTRHACYLVVQNADPSNERVAFAQTYLATQSRRVELLKKAMSGTTNPVSGLAADTGEEVEESRSPIMEKAMSFAAEMTIYNARKNHMRSSEEIMAEHTASTEAVRRLLRERGVVTEARR